MPNSRSKPTAGSHLTVLIFGWTLETQGALQTTDGPHLRDSNLIIMKTWKFKVPQMILHETKTETLLLS